MKRLLTTLTLALVASAHAADLKLILKDEASTIRKGELKTTPIVKSWAVPAEGVKATQKVKRLSTTITPILDRMEKTINSHLAV
ncbi:hypothetical protein [Deinococcus sp. ME38]|uniref:hypothetical protein n=1 Tax=Deinococcus sp. ME38 TaxID=3400344 RepID=UPI003B59BFB8